MKGVYHINAVDEVTQWEVVGAVEQISEAYLLPVLKAILAQFPFSIRGFHSDNGSEYINHPVAELLNKLLIEQTKSRPRRMQRQWAGGEQERSGGEEAHGVQRTSRRRTRRRSNVLRKVLQPVLNFHRPCGVPELVVNAKGKRRVYRWYATPWEILRQLPDVAGHLKAGCTIAELDQQAQANSDTQAAGEMQAAKRTVRQFPGKTDRMSRNNGFGNSLSGLAPGAKLSGGGVRGKGYGNGGAVEREEKHKQLSPLSTAPWKSR